MDLSPRHGSFEEILWTGFSGALWCTASSFVVEFSIIPPVRGDPGCPGQEISLQMRTVSDFSPSHSPMVLSLALHTTCLC